MSKPAPRQNFMTTLLFMLVIMLGFNLLFPKQPPDPKVQQMTTAEVLKQIRSDNAQIKEATISGVDLPLLRDKVGEDLKKKLLTQDDADKLLLEGDVLLADTQLKASILRLARGEPSDNNILLQSYYGFRNDQKKYKNKPFWTQPIKVADVTQNKIFSEAHPGDWNSWTGADLFDEITTKLDKKFRSDLLLGFVPGYQVVDMLVNFTGAVPAFSYAFAAFLLALLVRAIIYPLAQKQLMWSRQMSRLQPMVKEIKKQYSKEIKDPRTGKKTEQVTDQQALQMKTMELYKEYGINPLAGCLPAVIQMPLFLTVYQCMIHYQFTFQKGTFLWMNPAASKASHGFFAANLGQQDNIMIVLYGITMVSSTLLTPVSDPSQLRQQRMLGVGMALLFTVAMFFGFFPVPGAFVLYWTFTNLLSVAQSLRAYRMPIPPLEKVNAPGGGVYPSSGTPANRKMGWMERMQEEMRKKYEAAQTQREGPAAEPPANGKAHGENLNGSKNGKPSLNGPKKGDEPNKPGNQPKHKPKKRQPNPGGEE